MRGDKDLAYGRIMQVMGTITQGGFTKVALLAEQPAAASTPGRTGHSWWTGWGQCTGRGGYAGGAGRGAQFRCRTAQVGAWP